ncbi:MAG TPA: nitroreductase family protein [Tepidiformaceae bacterium]|nr:nitroreductase family protein [Tepidiformaceae bacterium]
MSEGPGLFEVMYNTRAMRRLKPDPVPHDLLTKLIDAAHQAPSGSNTQNARWLIVTNPESKARLAEINLKAVLAYAAANRPDTPFFDQARRDRMTASVVWQAEHLHEAPALIFACLEMGRVPSDRFWLGANSGGSVWPGVQNLLLAARALGLGATLTTLIFSDRPAVKEILGLPETIEPFGLIPVGYPLGKFGPVSRRPLDEVLRWERWD